MSFWRPTPTVTVWISIINITDIYCRYVLYVTRILYSHSFALQSTSISLKSVANGSGNDLFVEEPITVEQDGFLSNDRI